MTEIIITIFRFLKELKPIFKISLFVLATLIFAIPVDAKIDIVLEKLNDQKAFNDFVVGPGKIEMELEPGQSGTFEISVTNRLGTDKTFTLSEEDFVGSEDPSKTVVLLGNDRSPYSMMDYISISTTSINIPHANRARIPVTVSIPKNAEPGGVYGSVLIGTLSKADAASQSSGVNPTNPVITRIGTLVFVKVKGEIVENGKLSNFTINSGSKLISGLDAINFQLLYKNEGNIHLNPKGTITIKNILGSTVGTIEVEPWFAMPKSTRFREVIWSPNFLFGKYTALASVERGYGDLKDELSYSFWAIPWKVILALFVIIALIFTLIRYKKSRKVVAVIVIILLPIFHSDAEVMSSSNFKLESDSINFAGNRSASGSYIIEDTLGELATGISSSTNYTMKAGYQQVGIVTISVTAASDVVMSPSIGGLTGGTSNGQTSFTVTTDNPAGYTTTISAEGNPALNTATDSFADYVPAGAVPDFTFTNASDSSSFAFTPEGTDIDDRYKDSGVVCGVGALDTANACWDGLSIAGKTILNRTSSNQPAGTASTIKFRAESGSSHVQEDGVYVATTTITVLTL